MGERHPYRCPACGYLALVSGGDDCGFFVATRTVVCDRCAKILDVVASETPWDPDTMASYCMLRCPACDGLVHPWHHRTCPCCRDRMEPDPEGSVIHWD